MGVVAPQSLAAVESHVDWLMCGPDSQPLLTASHCQKHAPTVPLGLVSSSLPQARGNARRRAIARVENFLSMVTSTDSRDITNALDSSSPKKFPFARGGGALDLLTSGAV
jgi:hypothetical protein